MAFLQMKEPNFGTGPAWEVWRFIVMRNIHEDFMEV